MLVAVFQSWRLVRSGCRVMRCISGYFCVQSDQYLFRNETIQQSKGFSSSTDTKKFVLSQKHINSFREDGFLIVPSLISKELVEKINSRIEPLFSGQFETGIYPDEWHWRKGLSLPDVTREICNAWKCDLTIASVVLSSHIGNIAASLAGWSGARIAQDDIWVKPPKAGKEIAYHRDSWYIPWDEVTCWIALDNVSSSSGTLEYVKGSQKWKSPTNSPTSVNVGGSKFHAPKDYYKISLKEAAKNERISNEQLETLITKVEVSAGGAAFHNGKIWHGSGMNVSNSWRRSIGIHLIPSNSSFKGQNVGYIYGRYKLDGSDKMEETFFPITWQSGGYRTPFLQKYCKDALRK